ncbi:aromatic acid exporter family protein [Streptomyces sp. NPDC059853]|uniref:FUSC family protein n=1 Tax=Streptomyces sp. NPDC059853 TaxID=3346973 RepID=UPI003649ADFE
MPDLSEQVVDLAKRGGREPVVAQTLRSTTAATLSYIVALWLTNVSAPLLAPLTALLVVQVTLFATITSGIRRVTSVVVGVVVAAGFSAIVGLSWWSLGLLILCALTVGHLVRVSEFVPEVAISAMLVLGVAQVAETAWDRVAETLIGAVVGLLFNVIFVPPVWVQSAGEDIEDLAARMRDLLLRLAEQSETQRLSVTRAEQKLDEARQLDQDITTVDASLRQAEESLRLNPRVKEGLLTRIVLRTGLDTLEVCAVILRTMSRSQADIAARRTGEPLVPPEVGPALRDLLANLARAVDSFATLITSQVNEAAEEAEDNLIRELEASRASRERLAQLMLTGVREHPRQWQFHGSILAEADRMLDELDVEKRSLRVMEELDRYSRERRDRMRRLRRKARIRVRSSR